MKNKKAVSKAKPEVKAPKVAPVSKSDKKTIENHKQAATHHMEAAKHHLDAAKHYEAGNYEKAAYNALLAHGHHAIAGEFISDDAKHHAQTKKETNYHH